MPILPKEQPLQSIPKPLTKEDIDNIFSVLHLESENQRERFRVMSEDNKRSEVKSTTLWLPGTPDFQQENQGVSHA